MKEKTLLVMAAGMGSRFGGLKQVEPVGPSKEFIIDYSVYDAKRAGFTKVVFVIKKELEDIFKETIGKRIEDKIKVSYAFQELDDIPTKKYLVENRKKPWGTVQAILCASKEIEGDFVVINADDFYGYDSFMKASRFLDRYPEDNTYACISYPYINVSSKYGSVKRAVCFKKNENITSLIESSITTMDGYALCVPLNGDEEFKINLEQSVSMNMFAFHRSFLVYLDEYFREFFDKADEFIMNNEALLADVVAEQLALKNIILKDVVSNGRWLGMTYREDLAEVKMQINDLIEKGEYPKKLWG